MKRLILIIFIALNTLCLANDEACEELTTYRAIQPINFKDYYRCFDNFDGRKSDLIEEALRDNEKTDASNKNVLKLFPNESSRVYIEEFDQKKGFNAAGIVSLSKKDKLYVVTIDYLKYRTDRIDMNVFVSGFGLRMRAKIKTTNKGGGINLSSLYALGLAASENKLSGSLEFDSIGVTGAEITPLVPIPSNLSMESIATAMQALASIKAKLYDGEVDVWPQITGTIGPSSCESLKALSKSFAKLPTEEEKPNNNTQTGS